MTTHPRCARLRAYFSTRLSTGTLTGIGTLVEMSRTGGLVEMDAPWKPAIGSSVDLEIVGFGTMPVALASSVVRHTEAGFAVAWRSLTIEVLMLLESLGAS